MNDEQIWRKALEICGLWQAICISCSPSHARADAPPLGDEKAMVAMLTFLMREPVTLWTNSKGAVRLMVDGRDFQYDSLPLALAQAVVALKENRNG
jgi:hypothetical protein